MTLVEAVPDAVDRLEEYVPGDPRHLYDRCARHVVRDADGASVRARVHLAAPAVAARPRARAAPIEGGGWRITDR
ncbi:hypothetical protein [Streptomyces rochei]|uniref:hypothetical protein n=1 Tax=Streptomyces rochei TaxID=1928 RepID=UPI003F4BB6ED